MLTAADDRADSLDTEAQIRSWSGDLDAVSLVHQGLQRLHARHHRGVIERTDPEEKFSKGLRAHLSLLGHRGGGPAKNHPAGLIDPVIKSRAQLGGEKRHLGLGNIGHLGDVLGSAHGDVGLHLLESGQIKFGHCGSLRAGDPQGQFPTDTTGVHHDVGLGFRGTGGTDQGDHEFLRRFRDINEHALTSLQLGGVRGKNSGQSVVSGIRHESRGWAVDD